MSTPERWAGICTYTLNNLLIFKIVRDQHHEAGSSRRWSCMIFHPVLLLFCIANTTARLRPVPELIGLLPAICRMISFNLSNAALLRQRVAWLLVAGLSPDLYGQICRLQVLERRGPESNRYVRWIINIGVLLCGGFPAVGAPAPDLSCQMPFVSIQQSSVYVKCSSRCPFPLEHMSNR